MDAQLNSSALAIARFWADGCNRTELVIRGFARQIQDHLAHGSSPDYLRALAAWMSFEHPDVLDIDLAMRLRNAPRPEVTARSGHACPCRGGAVRGSSAPAPARIRQLIRSPHSRAA